MLTLGLLARIGRIDLVTAISVAVVAALLGDSIGHWEGRLLAGRLRVCSLGRLLGRRHWQRAEEAMNHAGAPAVTLGRWTAYIRTLVLRLAGAGGMTYRRFLAYNAAGIGVWIPGSVLLGYAAAGTLPAVVAYRRRCGAHLCRRCRRRIHHQTCTAERPRCSYRHCQGSTGQRSYTVQLRIPTPPWSGASYPSPPAPRSTPCR